ncbi:sarcosine oxidase subunit gamma [Roseobacter sp. EG26]|uniref:sarcosine oxidase subunit gamma n=1 Tax=Roseobacter sp. EG26 TaxID=3412477 RepID=UPI003CE5A3C3
MHDLTQITALGGSDAETFSVAGVTCREVPEVALASVAARMGKESLTCAAVKKAIGVDAPDIARFAEASLCAFWTGPDQYMVEAPFETHEDIAAHIKSLTKDNASVTEQTDGWTRFDLTGAGVRDVFELLCALNIRDSQPGSAQRTSIHHLGCFALCRAEETFSIYGPRASAGSLQHAIHTAMKAAL